MLFHHSLRAGPENVQQVRASLLSCGGNYQRKYRFAQGLCCLPGFTLSPLFIIVGSVQIHSEGVIIRAPSFLSGSNSLAHSTFNIPEGSLQSRDSRHLPSPWSPWQPLPFSCVHKQKALTSLFVELSFPLGKWLWGKPCFVFHKADLHFLAGVSTSLIG